MWVMYVNLLKKESIFYEAKIKLSRGVVKSAPFFWERSGRLEQTTSFWAGVKQGVPLPFSEAVPINENYHLTWYCPIFFPNIIFFVRKYKLAMLTEFVYVDKYHTQFSLLDVSLTVCVCTNTVCSKHGRVWFLFNFFFLMNNEPVGCKTSFYHLSDVKHADW